MPILFDHECPSGHVFEEFVSTGSPDPVKCPECSQIATRLITGTRLDPRLGVDASAYPTLAAKWDRVRRQKQQIEAKRARDHGD